METERNNDIIRYRNDLEVIRETASQVIKDFGMFGIDITFSGNEATAYDELKVQLIPWLRKLHETDYARLQSLYYRIDLPEHKVNALMAAGKDEFIDGLAGLILERELLKVITRKLYAHKSKSGDV